VTPVSPRDWWTRESRIILPKVTAMMDSVTTIGLIACDGRVVILSAVLVVRVDQSVGCVYARSVSSGDKYDEINILFKLAT